MATYQRVQDTKTHTKYSIIDGADLTGLKVLKQPAVDEHGEPLAPEFHTPSATAEATSTTKES